MLLLVGVLFLALGLLSGAALVAGSLGLLALGSSVTLWVTFPVLCLVGFGVVAANAKLELVRSVSLASATLLLVLAAVSVVVLVLGATSLMHPAGSTASLWFVLVVGAALGSLGAASFGRRAASA